jgi:carbon-monoxide dehydrogenase medium subunit
MRPFDYFEPPTLDEALDLLHRYGDNAKVLAGGTDLIVQMKQRKVCPRAVISLGRIQEINFVKVDFGLRLGPMTPLSIIASHPFFPGRLALLSEAARAVGDRQIRNVATVGGNLATASPSADMVPALLALGAKLRLQKKGREREMSLDEFYVAPFRTQLQAEELIVEIFISPLPPGGGAYSWIPKRTAVDETLVGISAWLTCDSEKKTCLKASLALTAVGPVPFKARNAETFLQGKKFNLENFQIAGEIAAKEASPRSRADYRRRVISILTEEALQRAWRRAEQDEHG